MHSTGSAPARLYGLAKVHKIETLLRQVLSTPRSNCSNLNKTLTQLFDKVPGANIETSTFNAQRPNVPVNEAIKIALRRCQD